MGIDFRGATYRKDVTFGKRTIKAGEACAVWDRLGRHTEVVGPRLIRLFFATINFLDRHTAGPDEYLIITMLDGSVQHRMGPVSMFANPVYHRDVRTAHCISLPTAAHCLVVHREVSVYSSLPISPSSSSPPSPPPSSFPSSVTMVSPAATAVLDSRTASASLPTARSAHETAPLLPTAQHTSIGGGSEGHKVWDSNKAATTTTTITAEERVGRKAEKQNKRIVREIIHGPHKFFPDVGDKLVEFHWRSGGADCSSSDEKLAKSSFSSSVTRRNKLSQPGFVSSGGGREGEGEGAECVVLRTSCRQWPISVPFEVSTRWQGMLQLSFAFSIVDVNRMVDQSSDVTGDMYEAVTIDLARLSLRYASVYARTSSSTPVSSNAVSSKGAAGDTTFATTTPSTAPNGVGGGGLAGGGEDGSNVLSSLHLPSTEEFTTHIASTYPCLLQRCAQMGVHIENVAFRGFEASESMKQQAAEMAQLQARITKENMLSRQAQRKLEDELGAQRARVKMENDLQAAQWESKRALLDAQHEFEQTQLNFSRDIYRGKLQVEIARQAALNDEALRVLGSLQNMGVDLNGVIAQRCSVELAATAPLESLQQQPKKAGLSKDGYGGKKEEKEIENGSIAAVGRGEQQGGKTGACKPGSAVALVKSIPALNEIFTVDS